VVADVAEVAKLGVEVAVVDRKKYAGKPGFEAAITHELEERDIDLIALAGFMRILSGDFVRHFSGRMINVHPSLLPAFPGAHGIRDAFEAKVKETGVTVHFVDEGVDTGPIILQKKIAVDPRETLESLEAKIHQVEYEIYPEALRLVLSGKVRMPSHHRDDEFWTND
jgi:phosphoribosylglycinamide formyltransferase-1